MSDYNERVVAEAETIIEAAIRDVLSGTSQKAVIGVAPAGAGKSYAIGTAVKAARRDGLSVVVGTPTNEQAFALVSSLADRMPSEGVTFVAAGKVSLPDEHARRNVSVKSSRESSGDGIRIGTLNKLGDAHARGDLPGADLLLIDEAYQASAVHYYLVGDLAQRHLLVGDSGQLAPFTSAPDSDRWRGLPEDPLLRAVEVVIRNHPSTPTYQVPITRRLDPRAVPVARAFYPGHAFEAAVLPGVRKLTLEPAPGARRAALEDAALDRAAEHGWAHVELPRAAVLTADPATAALFVALLTRLFARAPTVQCENTRQARALSHADVAVAVSHNDQKALLRHALHDAGLEGVLVDTANKLQGLHLRVRVRVAPARRAERGRRVPPRPGPALRDAHAPPPRLRRGGPRGRPRAGLGHPPRDSLLRGVGHEPRARRLVRARGRVPRARTAPNRGGRGAVIASDSPAGPTTRRTTRRSSHRGRSCTGAWPRSTKVTPVPSAQEPWISRISRRCEPFTRSTPSEESGPTARGR